VCRLCASNIKDYIQYYTSIPKSNTLPLVALDSLTYVKFLFAHVLFKTYNIVDSQNKSLHLPILCFQWHHQRDLSLSFQQLILVNIGPECFICEYICIFVHVYTGCTRKNLPYFGRSFLRISYIDIPKNSYDRIWNVTEKIKWEQNVFLLRFCVLLAWRTFCTLAGTSLSLQPSQDTRRPVHAMHIACKPTRDFCESITSFTIVIRLYSSQMLILCSVQVLTSQELQMSPLFSMCMVIDITIKLPWHGVDNPPTSRAKVEGRVELYISPSGPSWPVIGWVLPLPLL
jgi:hypothetical protein